MPEKDARNVPEGELVPISALQHMLYCPRRCALVHIERQWAENRFTAEGRVLHKRPDAGGAELRRGVRIARRVHVRSKRLGISGIADVVEIREEDDSPFPVEYKRGGPKNQRNDEVQLCAQAMCLEEMLAKPVPEGALFYGRNRRRRIVTFNSQLRTLTEKIAAETRCLIAEGQTPKPVYEPRKCQACSLIDLCQPRQPQADGAVGRWLAAAIED